MVAQKTWSEFCKDYAQKKGVSYKEAMSECKEPWQKYKAQTQKKGCANHAKCDVKARGVIRLEPVVPKETKKQVKKKVKVIEEAKEAGSYLPLKEFAFVPSDNEGDVEPQQKKKKQRAKKKSTSGSNMEDFIHLETCELHA